MDSNSTNNEEIYFDGKKAKISNPTKQGVEALRQLLAYKKFALIVTSVSLIAVTMIFKSYGPAMDTPLSPVIGNLKPFLKQVAVSHDIFPDR